MKKFISIALCVIFTVLLASCNFGEKTSSKPTDKPVYFYDPPEIVENPTIGSRSESLDFIFNNQTLGETTIVIKRSEWNKLCDDYRYLYKNENFVCADSYTYEKGGQKWVIKNVGFRLRGNTSRYCPQGLDNGREQGQMNADWNADYYNTEGVENNRYRQVHFKVDFEEFAADGVDVKMADCMKCVALKRMDASCTREIFCYDLFHRYGIWTAPRASHTKVTIKIIEDIKNPSAAEATTTVNYGVYEMFEEVNKQSLKARDKDENTSKNAWQNSKGNLWKCSNDLTIGRSREMGVEDIRIIHSYEGRPTGFQTNGRENGDRVGYVWKQYSLDLKTNKDNFSAASAELRGFIQELNALPNTDDESDIDSIAQIKSFYEKWFDVDFFLKTYAVNILCGMDDDYWGNANNFYLYFDTGKNGSGKVYFIPFDYDNTLGCSIKEGGYKHNPLDWGRGANRPLIDKLLMVPEYKTKFVNYLLEVSEEDSEWNFEKCSQRFLNWKDMVGPYLYSSDLTGKLSTLYWGDYDWQPGGNSLISEGNNIYDATSFYFRLNLGEADWPKSGTVAKQVRNPKGLSGSDECMLSVTSEENGLRIKKSHNSVWNHISICIYDENDGLENARISADENKNDFLYPFVKKDHVYTVWMTIQASDYDWDYIDLKNEGISVLVQASGGVGNYRITKSNYHYNSFDHSIIFDNLQFIEPDINYQNVRIDGTICDDGDWNGNRIYPTNLQIESGLLSSVLDLSSQADFLRGKEKIFVEIKKKFTFDDVDYEYTIVANYNNFFKDTNEVGQIQLPDSEVPEEIIQYETGSPSDADGPKASNSGSKKNPDGSFSNSLLSVTPKYNGLYIEKSHDYVWDHVAIHVYDETIGKENVRIVTDAYGKKFLYPFVEKNHEYRVWLTVQAEQANWYYSDFKDIGVKVKAVGGKGNYWVSHSDYYYDSQSYSVVFDDLTFAYPILPGVSTRIDAGIYNNGAWSGTSHWPGNLPLIKSVLDLSVEKNFLKGQQMIFVSATLKFQYEGINYEYTVLENGNRLFKDTN